MSDEITPITLLALYEMMVDLTRGLRGLSLFCRVPIVVERNSGVARPSLPHLTSSTSVTLGASHPQYRPHSVLQHSSSISLVTMTRPPSRLGPSDYYGSSERLHPSHGILAPLAPRALPDPVPPQFRLDLYCVYHQSAGHHTDRCTALRHAIQDIIDSGTFGHPQSDMFPIPTSAQAMHVDSLPPTVDPAWRELTYDLWMAYDVWIGRLLDETVTCFSVIDPEGAAWSMDLDGPILIDHHLSSHIHCFAVVLSLLVIHPIPFTSYSLLTATHLGFDTCFTSSFHISLSASSGPGLTGLTIHIFRTSTLGCHHASPSGGHLGYMCMIQLWIRMTSVTCATIDDFMTFVLRTCCALDVILWHIFHFRCDLWIFTYIYGSSWSCMLIPTYEIHIDTMFPPWSLSGVTQLGLHFATL
ncbi:hypothetical protein AAG906_035404 [Vitis piasezkii]